MGYCVADCCISDCREGKRAKGDPVKGCIEALGRYIMSVELCVE